MILSARLTGLPWTGRTCVIALSAWLGACLCLSACGGGGASERNVAPRTLRIELRPSSATVQAGDTERFDAIVTNATDTTVTWSVNGQEGGSAAAGTITAAGVYTAPDVIPASETVTISATSRQDSSRTATASVSFISTCSGAAAAAAFNAPGAFAFSIIDNRVEPLRTIAGANHAVVNNVAEFECSSVAPGDMITLASGVRGPLTIRNCNGTPSDPIIVRNDPDGNAPTEIQRTSGSGGGFLLACDDCVSVVIDGSYKWQGAPTGKTYGIKVTMTGGEGPSAFVRIGGLSRFVTIRHVEVDGAWPRLGSAGSGIRVNDHSVKRSEHPELWREGITIEDNYVHDVRREGMYVGPNYADGDLPLRNIEIRYNRVEDTGWDGINTKSMWAGDNLIHHNEVRRAGKNDDSPGDSTQYSGIKNMSGTAKIYNNWVETTGQHGIAVGTQDGPKISEGIGPFEAHIWNNVIVDAGALWRPFMTGSFGISVGAQDGCEKPVPFIYNNTIVNPRQGGINVRENAGEGFVRDNIVAGVGVNPAISVPGFVELQNNLIGPVTQMQFLDPDDLDFRLNVQSPARNQGGATYPPTDFDDVARPQGGAPDQGAFEENSS
jgi:hypothetical protein